MITKEEFQERKSDLIRNTLEDLTQDDGLNRDSLCACIFDTSGFIRIMDKMSEKKGKFPALPGMRYKTTSQVLSELRDKRKISYKSMNHIYYMMASGSLTLENPEITSHDLKKYSSALKAMSYNGNSRISPADVSLVKRARELHKFNRKYDRAIVVASDSDIPKMLLADKKNKVGYLRARDYMYLLRLTSRGDSYVR